MLSTPLSPPKSNALDPLDYAPVVGRFVGSQPTTDAKSVSRVFEDFRAAEQKRQTWRAYLKAGDFKRAAAYLAENREEIASVASSEDTGGNAGFLRQVDKALGDITKARRELAASKMPEEAKNKKLHELGLLERTVARSYYTRRGLLGDSR